MSLLEATTGDWQPHLLVELQLLRDDLEGLPRQFAHQDRFTDAFIDARDVVDHCCRGTEVHFLFLQFISPIEPPRERFHACQWQIIDRIRFVVAVRAHCIRKKFAPLSRAYHMFDEPGDGFLVFVLRVLLVQDAVARVAKTDAAEAVPAAVTFDAVIDVTAVPRKERRHRIRRTHGGCNAVTPFERSGRRERRVVSVVSLGSESQVLPILAIGDVEAVVTVLAVVNCIAGTVFTAVRVRSAMGECLLQRREFLLQHCEHRVGQVTHLLPTLREFLFRELFVEDAELLPMQAETTDAITARLTIFDEQA